MNEELEQGDRSGAQGFSGGEALSLCFLHSSEATLRRQWATAVWGWEYKKWSKGAEDIVGWRVREEVC